MSLVRWWKLDGNAYDSSPNRNHGTLGGTPGVTFDPSYGKIGQGAKFISNDDSYIDVPEYNITTHHSLAFWVYHNQEAPGGGTGSQTMGMFRESTNLVILVDDTRFRFIGSGTDADWLKSNGNDTDFYHRWRHIVLLCEVSTCNLFIDAVAQPSNPQSYAGTFDLNNIGAPSSTSSNDFNGYFSDIRIYDHILSMKEIKHLAEAKVLHWQFSHERNTSGQLISDGSGYGRNATLDVNAPTWSSDTGVGVGCYDFSSPSSSEYIEIDSGDFPVEFEDAISISLRINYEEFSGWRTLVHGTTEGNLRESYWLGMNGDNGDMRWSINSDSYNDFAHGMEAGNWYHICATYDGSNCNVYINAEEKAGNFDREGVIDNQNGFKIGKTGDGN